MLGLPLLHLTHRWVPLVLLAGILPGADPPTPQVSENGGTAMEKVVAVLVDWAAGGESGGSPRPGEENFLKGGEYGPAIVGYEKAKVICDTLRFWQDDRITAIKRLVPVKLLVEPGPFGQDKQRVIVDTRACRLPKIGFRGLIRPLRITAERQGLDPAAPAAVRFKAVFSRVGDFFGDLRIDQGWEHYAAWAHEIEMVIRGDIDPQLQELVNLRLETLHLFGREREGDEPRETALMMRLKDPFAEGRSAKGVDRDAETIAGAEAMLITLFFDEQGTMEKGKWETKRDVHGWGGDQLFGPRKATAPSSPVLLPTDPKPHP